MLWIKRNPLLRVWRYNSAIKPEWLKDLMIANRVLFTDDTCTVIYSDENCQNVELGMYIAYSIENDSIYVFDEVLLNSLYVSIDELVHTSEKIGDD